MWEEKERRIRENLTKPRYICSNCGETCRTPYEEDTSCIGCLMWIVFIFISMGIGLIIFIIYKLCHSPKPYCPSCKALNTLVPLDSPRGQKLLNEYYETDED